MNFPMCVIIVLFAISGLSKAKQSYTVKIEDAECFNGLKNSFFSCEVKLIGRKRLLNGTITIGEDMDSGHYKFNVEILSSPKGDDQYKLLPWGIFRMEICEGFKNYYAQVLQPSLIPGENTNLPFMPKEGLCPFPKGEYFIKNIELETDSWPNQLPRGVLKAVLTFFKDEENVGGAEIFLRIEVRE